MLTGPFPLLRTLAIGVAAAAVLAGCATPSEAAPAALPGGDASPSASPSTEIATPGPYVDVSCAELLSTPSLAAAFGVPVAALDVVGNIKLSSNRGQLRFALRQAGGIECEWSNGEPIGTESTPNPLYVGVTLRVLPGADDHWPQYNDSVERTSCTPSGLEPIHCSVDALVEQNWLEIELQGAADSIGDGANAGAVTMSLYNEFSAALSAAPDSSAEWAAPTNTVRLEVAECGQFLSAADAAAILGASAPVNFDGMDGGFSLVGLSWANAGGAPCPWVDSEGESLGVVVSWLPGGEWAWLETPRRDSSEAVEVPGLSPGDAAWLDCATSTGDCVLDLIVGHNWIQIELLTDYFTDADRPVLLAHVAAKVVESVRAAA